MRGLRGDLKGLKANVKIMAASGGGDGSSSSLNPPPSSAPKILLAKPDLVTSSVEKFSRGGADAVGEDDSSVSIRSRIPSIDSLNLISNSSWDFHSDRYGCCLCLQQSQKKPRHLQGIVLLALNLEFPMNESYFLIPRYHPAYVKMSINQEKKLDYFLCADCSSEDDTKKSQEFLLTID